MPKKTDEQKSRAARQVTASSGVPDFTYLRTWAGFVYVAFIVYVFAQRVLAWHAANSNKTDLVMVPLRGAWRSGRGTAMGRSVNPGELIRHSDAGSLHVDLFHRALWIEALRPSIGGFDDAYDNALMECVNGPC